MFHSGSKAELVGSVFLEDEEHGERNAATEKAVYGLVRVSKGDTIFPPNGSAVVLCY